MRIKTLFISILMLIFVCGFNFDQTKKVSSVEAKTVSQERKAVYTYDSKIKKKEEKIYNRVIELKYISAEKVLNVISRIIPSVIAINEGLDTLVLRGKSSSLYEAVKLIRTIDKEPSQIIIEGKVIEISENDLNSLGITWGREQGTFKFSVDPESGDVSTTDDFLVTINALIANGKASVLACPKITTLDGKQSEINIGSRIPYAVPANSSISSTQWTIRYIDAGVKLKILSHIKSDGIIISNIRPEVSTISEWRSTAAGEFPVISTRNANVTVKIKDGETLAIGGLINKTERENVSKIPLLADIPFLGWLFQRTIKEEAKTEIVFLITPKILK